MPYNFKQYTSTYVDPQTTKIAEILRNRFMDNFNTNDVLRDELRQMKSADFENDMKIKSDIDFEVGEKLNDVAFSGDYENAAFQIHSAANEYKDRYLPILNNYQRYAQYKTDLAKSYEEGKISTAAYKAAVPLTKALGYKGVKLDPETGTVDESSYFTGISVVNNPKIQDKLIQALNVLHADSRESTVSDISQGPDGMYQVKTMNGWSGITKDKVEKAYGAVMSDPEVQAFLNQEAMFQAYLNNANEDGSLNEQALDKSLAAGIQSHQDNISKLNSLINSKGVSEAKKTAYRRDLAAYTESLNNLKGINSLEGKLSYASNAEKQNLLAPYQALAESKIYNETKSSYERDYDKLWMAKRSEELRIEADLKKARMLAEANVVVDKNAALVLKGKSIAELQAEKGTIEKGIDEANAILAQSTAGEEEKVQAATRLSTLTSQLDMINKIMQAKGSVDPDQAIQALIDENTDYGDVDNFGFGTYGIDAADLVKSFKNWISTTPMGQDYAYLNSSANTNGQFAQMLNTDNGNGHKQAFLSYLRNAHSGEDPALALDEFRQAFATKSQEISALNTSFEIDADMQSIPMGNPMLAEKSASTIKEQFPNLASLTGVEGIIAADAANKVFTPLDAATLTQDARFTNNGITGNSKITNISYQTLGSSSNFIDGSETGTYVRMQIDPDPDAVTTTTNPRSQFIYVPIEKVSSHDMMQAMNEPINVFARSVNTVYNYTRATEQSYTFHRGITSDESDAINFEQNIVSLGTDQERRQYIDANKDQFQRLQAAGLINNKGYSQINPVEVKIDVSNIVPGVSVNAEIFTRNSESSGWSPMTTTDPYTGQTYRIGKMDAGGDEFKRIMNGSGFYDGVSGYTIKY
jgi:hypothetical protein